MPFTNLAIIDPITELSWDWGWSKGWADAKSYLNQRIFGSLVSLAQPVMTEYQGDLYHDAIWLNRKSELDQAPSEFWFAVRESGTHLYDELGDIQSVKHNWPAALIYHCTLTELDGRWTFSATLMV